MNFHIPNFLLTLWNNIDILKYALMSQNYLKEEPILRKSPLKINK